MYVSSYTPYATRYMCPCVLMLLLHTCALILVYTTTHSYSARVYMCRNAIYVSACYICGLTLYMCPHAIYVASCYLCVLMLYICPHAIYIASCYICFLMLYICVLRLLDARVLIRLCTTVSHSTTRTVLLYTTTTMHIGDHILVVVVVYTSVSVRSSL
jgi:hypothetical protein